MDAGWQMGHAGVDLFFVLSGYLIYGAVIRRPTPYGRSGRRLRRIYPVFLTVFAVYVLLDLTIAGTHRIPSEPWPAIGYLLANLALLPGIVPIDPLLTVAWSLSFEFFYYLTIPLAVALLRMRRWQPRQRLLFFAGVALAASRSATSCRRS
ncbi:MAG: acyltransferase family protein [Micropruina sp.]